tara:strand:+ start:310 stop:612 length:303 start_codon:yes stop_codon:yes gene_type:complete
MMNRFLFVSISASILSTLVCSGVNKMFGFNSIIDDLMWLGLFFFLIFITIGLVRSFVKQLKDKVVSIKSFLLAIIVLPLILYNIYILLTVMAFLPAGARL